MNHLKAINQKAHRIREHVATPGPGAAPPASLDGPAGDAMEPSLATATNGDAPDLDVVALESGPPERSGPNIPLGCSLVFAPGWEVDSTGGTAGLCQPVERDLFDCHLACFWPAHVPDQAQSRAGLDGQVRFGAEGLAQDRPDLPVMPGLRSRRLRRIGRTTARRPLRRSPCLVGVPLAAAFPLAAVFALWAAPARAQSGGNGVIYMAAYDEAVHVIDESTLEIVDRIETTIGIPIGLTLSADHERIYVRDAEFEEVEIIDVATRTPINSFTLSRGRSRVRIWGLEVDPAGEFVLLNTMRYTKRIDRWEVDDPVLLKYDLAEGEVTDTVPWPTGEGSRRSRMMFSPDGEHLYFFNRGDVVIVDSDTFEVTDRWELSRPIEEGLGRFSFAFPSSPHDDEGFHTGLFNFTDPVQNRRMMGIARVNLADREFDFHTLGPSAPVSFRLAPGGDKAYGLVQRIGNYEFWTFDVAGRRVESRHRFAGRPRMGLEVSSNGELLYIYNAGSTIDVYDADSYEYLRTATYDADMTSFVMIPEGTGPRGG